MFVGSTVSCDKSYSDAVKSNFANVAPDEEKDSDLGSLFSPSVGDLEEGEIKEEKVNSVNETSRISNQLTLHGKISPCDFSSPRMETNKVLRKLTMQQLDDEPLPDHVSSYENLEENPKKRLKTNWGHFRSCMDNFVSKLENGEDVSESIQQLNDAHNKFTKLTYLLSPQTGLNPARSSRTSCDDRKLQNYDEYLGEGFVNDFKDLAEMNELTETYLGESDTETLNCEMNYMSVGSDRRRNATENWLLDSGSTVHLTNNKFMLTNLCKTNTNVTVGTGTTVQATIKGDVKLVQEISENVMILRDVLYVPSFNQHILSIPKLLKEGYTLFGNKTSLELVADNSNIITTNIMDSQNMFYLKVRRTGLSAEENRMLKNRKIRDTWNDQRIMNKKESYSINNRNRKCIACEKINNEKYRENKNCDHGMKCDIARLNARNKVEKFDKSIRRNETVKELESVPVRNDRAKKYVAIMDINIAHDKFGHVNEELLRKTCKEANIKLTGKLKDCLGCLVSKARAKGVSKATNERSKVPGDRLFMDTSGPYSRSLGGNYYWLKIVDDASRKNWNYFMKNKNQVTEKLKQHLNLMKYKRIKINRLRCK